MVTRVSEQVNPGVQTNTELRGPTGASFKAPNFAKFAKGASTADMLVSELLQVGGNLAQQGIKNSQEDAYLKGVQQASKVASEEELESSVFTREWTKAGYRDANGRNAQAQFQADLATQIPLLAEKGQEAFDQYLSEARERLSGQLTGMSRQQRAAGFAQLSTDIAGAQKKFTAARAKYIIGQETRSIQTSFAARRNNLDLAKGDPETYDVEVGAFAGAVYKDIWQNPRLPIDQRIELTRQAVEYAASSDNTAVYNRLKTMQFEFGDGTKGTLLSKLPFEDQIKLDKAQRQAMDRVKTIRASQFEDALARQQAEWNDPDGSGPTITYDELRGQLDVATEAGILSSSRRGSIQRDFFMAEARNGSNGTVAQAFAAGDFATLQSLGKSQEDGLKAYLKAHRTDSYQDTVQGLLAIGNNHGFDAAFTKVGELVAPAIAQVGYDKEINPDSAKLVHGLVLALDQAEGTNPGVYAKTLQSLNNEGQNLMLFVREAQRNGISDPLTAVQFARDQQLKYSAPGSIVPNLISEAQRADAKSVREIGDRQLLGTISGYAKSFFSGDAAARQRLSTGRAWFENEARTAEVRAGAQLALAEELSIISRTSPFLPDDARVSKALGAIAARTVDTESGPLIIPRGTTVQRFFGTPQYADQAYIGKAIDELVPVADGQRIAWSATPDGQLIYRKFDQDGRVAESSVFDPQSVAAKVQDNLEKEASEQSYQTGPGKIVTRGGSSVQFNGENTAGFDPRSMLLLREDIVDSEGVTNVAYGDGKVVKGNKAFGVGISQTGDYYQAPQGRDGLYTPRQINETFRDASNAAADVAARSMAATGLTGPDWLRFLGELAYQSPKSAQDSELLAHISLGNKEDAINRLRQLPAFKNSPTERQATYIKKLEKALR